MNGLESIARDVARLFRERPAIVVGAAVLALLAVRFLSREPGDDDVTAEDKDAAAAAALEAGYYPPGLGGLGAYESTFGGLDYPYPIVLPPVPPPTAPPPVPTLPPPQTPRRSPLGSSRRITRRLPLPTGSTGILRPPVLRQPVAPILSRSIPPAPLPPAVAPPRSLVSSR
jgi:hypothetical protein